MDAFARGQKALGGGTHGVSKEDSTEIEVGTGGPAEARVPGENSKAQGNRAKWRREIEARSSMRTPTVLP